MARLLREAADVAPLQTGGCDDAPRAAPAGAVPPKRRWGWWAAGARRRRARSRADGPGSARRRPRRRRSSPRRWRPAPSRRACSRPALLKPTELVAVGAQVSGRITRLAVDARPGRDGRRPDRRDRPGAAAERAPDRRGRARRGQGRAAPSSRRRCASSSVCSKRQQRSVAGSAVARSRGSTPPRADVAVTEAQIAALEAPIDRREVAVENARVEPRLHPDHRAAWTAPCSRSSRRRARR